MSDSKEFEAQNTPKPWGFMIGDRFVELPKFPMLAAGYGPPPFDVVMPDQSIRHVVEQPEHDAP